MKYLLILSLFLVSCTKVYKEIWTVEKYPVQWEEEIIVEGDHMHYEDEACKWNCLYFEKDTVCWQHYDTLVVRTYEKTERIK
jgi:hypothetical protein